MIAPARAGALAIAATVVAAGSLSLFRPGYTPDEEFTLFAVRGIAGSGLPLLPSGLVYDRGLLYSYASWLAAAGSGAELPAFRLLALLCCAAAVFVAFTVIRRTVSAPAGLCAAGLAAVSLPFWAVATTGRFYAPFLLAGIALVAAVARCRIARPDGSPPTASLLLVTALAFVARLTHELAFALAAIPAAGLAMDWFATARAPRSNRTRTSLVPWLWIAASIGIGLAAAQAALMAVHFAVPHSAGGGDTMIRRFFLWQVLNLFETPRGAPVGLVAALVVLAWLIAPSRAASVNRAGAAGLGLAIGAAIAHAAVSPSVDLRQALADSVVYPLDMFWSLAGRDPLLVTAALALMVLRLAGAGGEWPPAERAAHLGWVGWTLWFGVIESGITTNYLLLPTVCLMAAVGIDIVAIAQHTRAIRPGRRAQLIRAGLTGVALLTVADQWSGRGGLPERLAAARPTIHVPGIEEVASAIRAGDVVACTDELACLLLVGRVDAWLALDDYVRERFVVMRDTGPVGVYAGAPAVSQLAGLLTLRRQAGSRVLIVDLFKEYPAGNSREWLPRALEAEGLSAKPLLATAQARVVELGEGGWEEASAISSGPVPVPGTQIAR
jgi:hypothetical protein